MFWVEQSVDDSSLNLYSRTEMCATRTNWYLNIGLLFGPLFKTIRFNKADELNRWLNVKWMFPNASAQKKVSTTNYYKWTPWGDFEISYIIALLFS